jgi:hypothetical protein
MLALEMRHFASIIHLTDLHLFIDANGQGRSISERRVIYRLVIWSVGRFRSGFDTADWRVFDELLELLPDIVTAERGEGAHVVLLQTGDVEAFGYLPPHGLAGYEFLHRRVWPRLEDLGADCIDIYGNHDMWPGFPPLPGMAHDARRLMELKAFQDGWDAPIDVDVSSPIAIRLRFHRVNSIVTDRFFGGFLARGGVGPHPPDTPYDARNTDAVIERVRAASVSHGPPTLNVVAIHHPPHIFRPGLGTEWTTGYLNGSATLASPTPSDVQLIIAGHRHELDPVESREVINATQSPLNPGAAQLVAESPTQLARRVPKNSLAVYRLYATDDATTVDVERLLFSYSDVTGLNRIPDEETIYLSGLRTTR